WGRSLWGSKNFKVFAVVTPCITCIARSERLLAPLLRQSESRHIGSFCQTQPTRRDFELRCLHYPPVFSNAILHTLEVPDACFLLFLGPAFLNPAIKRARFL